GQFPADVRRPGVGVHAPLDLCAQQRMQAAQVDLAGAEHRISRRAPSPEPCLIAVADRDRLAAAFVAVGPLRWQGHRSALAQGPPSGLALAAVPALMPGAHPARRVPQPRPARARAAAVTRIGLLPGQPGGEVRAVAVTFTMPEPAELMLITQHEGDVAGRALR